MKMTYLDNGHHRISPANAGRLVRLSTGGCLDMATRRRTSTTARAGGRRKRPVEVDSSGHFPA